MLPHWSLFIEAEAFPYSKSNGCLSVLTAIEVTNLAWMSPHILLSLKVTILCLGTVVYQFDLIPRLSNTVVCQSHWPLALRH